MFYSYLLSVPKEGIPLDSGIWPGMGPTLAPLWAAGTNVRFIGGTVSKIPGWAALFTSPASVPVRGIHSQLVEGGTQLFFGTATNLYVWDGVSPTTAGSSYTGNTNQSGNTPATHWSFASWGDWTVAANGIDDIQLCRKNKTFVSLRGENLVTNSRSASSSTAVVTNITGEHLGFDGTEGTGLRVEDDNVAAIETATWTATVANDSQVYTGSVFLEKNKETSVAQFTLSLSGGTGVSTILNVRPSDGAVHKVSGASGVTAQVQNYNDTFWRVVLSVANNSTGNTTLSLVMAPAATGSLQESNQNSAVGTIYIDCVQLESAKNFAGNPVVTGSGAITNVSFVPKARILLNNHSHLLAFNLEDAENGYAWCSADNVEDWEIRRGNSAGRAYLREASSEIIAAVPLGDTVAVYTKSEMFIVFYQGAPFYFGHNLGLTGVGAVGQKAVVAVDRFNYGLGPLGFFRTDGASYQYLDEPAIREYFLSQINEEQISKTVAYFNKERNEVIFHYPSGSSLEPNQGLSLNLAKLVWAPYSFGKTSGESEGVFAYPITADAAGKVYKENSGANADTAALSSFIQTKAFAGKNSQVDKWLDAVLAEATVDGSLLCEIGLQDRLTDFIDWTGPFYLTEAVEPVYVEQSGRWITLKFSSTALSASWSISRLDVLGSLLGGNL